MKQNIENMTVLIAGSSGAIGSALSNSFAELGANVLTLSSTGPGDIVTDLRLESSKEEISKWFDERSVCPDLVVCCSGILHDSEKMPEKNLMQINKDWVQKSMEMNLISHIHLAQALDSLLSKEKPIIWASLSAMVGSISDNYLGGWYSYRMSKSALNMFVKSLSIEWSRKNKSNRVFSIHPGTTKSAMSDPFKVRKDKLYEPSLSAERIIKILLEADKYESGRFINWTGQEIAW